MEEINTFLKALENTITKDVFVKITLSKPFKKQEGLRNVYIRLITIKEEKKLSFTYHYTTNDQVKNYTLKEAQEKITALLDYNFRIITLFSLAEDYSLRISKKGKVATLKAHPSFSNKLPETHDQPKKKRAELGKYLMLLGITDNNGTVIPKMADKYKQINKYLEIIENLMKNANLSKTISIVDMGSGKGYLTFALYDYLVNQRKREVTIKGIELRAELVDFCNKIAKECGFDGLSFEQISIQQYQPKKIDILIALHACDTATDDALRKGLMANAQLIITAPCCHKQIRQQLKGTEHESPILKYGIFKERQLEMVTDTIRALILEQHQYNTQIFEFISNEHTRKNVLLVGQKSNKKPDVKMLSNKIKDLKKSYHIQSHYLEEIMN